jgi:hypothetical protein
MRIFEIEILIPPHEADGRPLTQRFYVIADTPDVAMALIKGKESVENAKIIRELNDEQMRAFRYLRSAES